MNQIIDLLYLLSEYLDGKNDAAASELLKNDIIRKIAEIRSLMPELPLSSEKGHLEETLDRILDYYTATKS